MSLVEVFKTNADNEHKAFKMIEIISGLIPASRVTIDTDDVDNILRVETFCKKIEVSRIIEICKKHDLYCEILNG